MDVEEEGRQCLDGVGERLSLEEEITLGGAQFGC
jgi:hypothetical protein